MFVFYSTLAQAGATVPQEGPSTFSVVVIGFLFVMIVLSLLAAVTSAIGVVFMRQAAEAAKQAAIAAQKASEAKGQATPSAVPVSTMTTPPARSESTDEDEDPALLAVVAAAVHTVIGDRPHRVVSVRSAGPGWAQEGRRQIFSSHRVR